ncbi:hypothetical protein [Paenibacillus sinensis]|uniref:hypothetical protein n=1 Tax=Paenibacillus sinensis TaxID=2834413 RepID=UPI001CA9C2C6|nr:hypothetical protein [Paenibacillus sinensis]
MARNAERNLFAVRYIDTGYGHNLVYSYPKFIIAYRVIPKMNYSGDVRQMPFSCSDGALENGIRVSSPNFQFPQKTKRGGNRK